MKEKYHFVALSGSLRKGSYNTSLLRTVQKLAPENIKIEQLFIDEVPLYNFDLFEHVFPPVVEKLNDAIKAADAVIIVTPEYNYSVPGVLKNAIDLISRSPKKPFDMKPVGIMGASTGMHGTSRAQYHLRQIMVFLNAYVMNRPELMVAQAPTKFDEQGNLIDEKTRIYIEAFIRSLAEFSDRFNNS
ncbi:MAG: NADPH-dependent FMN reductase [Candidatus Saccharibacteria bacterium]